MGTTRLQWSRHFDPRNSTSASNSSTLTTTSSEPNPQNGSLDEDNSSASVDSTSNFSNSSTSSTASSESSNQQNGLPTKENLTAGLASASILSNSSIPSTSNSKSNEQTKSSEASSAVASVSTSNTSTGSTSQLTTSSASLSTTNSATPSPTSPVDLSTASFTNSLALAASSTPTTFHTIYQSMGNSKATSAASIIGSQVIATSPSSSDKISLVAASSLSSSLSSPTQTSVVGSVCGSSLIYPSSGSCIPSEVSIPSTPNPSAPTSTPTTIPMGSMPVGSPLLGLSRMLPSALVAALLVIAVINRRKWIAQTFRRFSQERISPRRVSYTPGDPAPVQEGINLQDLRSPPPAYSPYRLSFDDQELMEDGPSINRMSLRAPIESPGTLDSGNQIQPFHRLSSDDREAMDWPHLFSFEDRGPADGPNRYSIVDRGPASAPNSPYRPNLADRELMGTAGWI